jgi:hypothetical protein
MSQADADRLVSLLASRVAAPGIEPPIPQREAWDFSSEEWDSIILLADRHSLAPWLGARVKALGVRMPGAAAEQLEDLHFASAARNMCLFERLGGILRAFEAAGIPTVLLKGAWLARVVYGDAALRPMGDIDLWIRQYQLDAARTVMQSLGYATRSKADRPLGLQDALSGETQMFKAGAPPVELHWNIYPGEWVRHTAEIDEQTIWDRSTPFGGDDVRQLSPEDAVIHLCVHLAVNHQMSGIGLRTLVDVDTARKKWTIDWTVVAERARSWRVSTATWIVLNALAELFGDPEKQLPLQDLAPSKLRRSILERFASAATLAKGLELSSGPGRFLFLLALVDRPIDATILAWRALFPDRLWLTLRYESPNASLWRVWRLRVWHLVRIATRGEV